MHTGQEIWDTEQGQCFLHLHFGHFVAMQLVISGHMSVTEASAQVGQAYGWLYFVSRSDLRDALAWRFGVSSAHNFR